jgi:hypothetical protein
METRIKIGTLGVHVSTLQSCAKMFWKTFFPSFPVFFPLPPLAMLIILTALPCATQIKNNNFQH